MTLSEFIAAVRAGDVIVSAADVEGDNFGTVEKPLTLEDPESVTAEAFAHGVFSSEDTDWEDALALVREALSR